MNNSPGRARTSGRIPNELDKACQSALHQVLRPERHHSVDEWMKSASETEKRGIIKLQKYAAIRAVDDVLGQSKSQSALRTNKKIPNDLDRACYSALHHVLRPEHHHLVDEWMTKASDTEERGIIKLKKYSEPALLNAVGRPAPGGHQPSMSMHNWHHPKSMRTGMQNPSGWPVRDHDDNGFGMGRSASMPSLPGMPGMQDAAPLYSWQREDMLETAQIEKPGGYVVQLKDSVEIQRKKNTTRNKGTYKLFGGSFDGTTTQAAFHNLRAIGLEPAFRPS